MNITTPETDCVTLLRNLSNIASSINARQRAGLTIPPDMWPALYDATNAAKVFIIRSEG